MWHGNGDSCSSPMSCLLLLQPLTTLGCSPGIKAEELLLLSSSLWSLGQTAQGGKERSLSLSVDSNQLFRHSYCVTPGGHGESRDRGRGLAV